MGFLDFLRKKKKQESNLKVIKLAFDYGTEHIWFYDEKDKLIDYKDAISQIGLENDKFFDDLIDKLVSQYASLFINDKQEFSFIGFKDKEQKIQMKKTIDELINYFHKVSDGKYEIIDNWSDAKELGFVTEKE